MEIYRSGVENVRPTNTSTSSILLSKLSNALRFCGFSDKDEAKLMVAIITQRQIRNLKFVWHGVKVDVLSMLS